MDKIAVVFPGIGYNFDRPLLHFGMEWAAENGYGILRVPYSGFPEKIRGSEERMRESLEIAMRQTKTLLQSVQWEMYESILYISKSIGTIVAADYAAGKFPVRDRFGRTPAQILFTPFPETFQCLPAVGKNETISTAANTIAFHGTADPWMDNDAVIKAAADRSIPMYLYDGANHSLETGNTGKDLETLRDIFMELEAWKNYQGDIRSK